MQDGTNDWIALAVSRIKPSGRPTPRRAIATWMVSAASRTGPPGSPGPPSRSTLGGRRAVGVIANDEGGPNELGGIPKMPVTLNRT